LKGKTGGHRGLLPAKKKVPNPTSLSTRNRKGRKVAKKKRETFPVTEERHTFQKPGDNLAR